MKVCEEVRFLIQDERVCFYWGTWWRIWVKGQPKVGLETGHGFWFWSEGNSIPGICALTLGMALTSCFTLNVLQKLRFCKGKGGSVPEGLDKCTNLKCPAGVCFKGPESLFFVEKCMILGKRYFCGLLKCSWSKISAWRRKSCSILVAYKGPDFWLFCY